MTNIPKQLQVNNSDFIVGDTVVFTEEKSCDCDLYEVEAVLDGGLFLGISHYRQAFSARNLRHATVAETKAKRRLPEPVLLFVSLDEPDREQFEKSHPHLDLHYVYALGEYSDAHTQNLWSGWQQLSIGADQYVENHISPRCKNISCDEAVHLANAFRSIGEV